MGRILAIDYGSRRVGLALSDAGQMIGSPFTTLRPASRAALLTELRRLVAQHDVERVVVGWPLSLKGRPTAQTEAVGKFVEELRASVKQPVELEDERLSSKEAETVLRAQGIRTSREKERIDATAAALMLQTYLERKRFR